MTKFCVFVDIQDLITCATFRDDRLRGVGVARGRIFHSPLTCVVALTTPSHYRASVIHSTYITVLSTALNWHPALLFKWRLCKRFPARKNR